MLASVYVIPGFIGVECCKHIGDNLSEPTYTEVGKPSLVTEGVYSPAIITQPTGSGGRLESTSPISASAVLSASPADHLRVNLSLVCHSESLVFKNVG